MTVFEPLEKSKIAPGDMVLAEADGFFYFGVATRPIEFEARKFGRVSAGKDVLESILSVGAETFSVSKIACGSSVSSRSRTIRRR